MRSALACVRTILRLAAILSAVIAVSPAFAAPGSGTLYGTDASGGSLLAIDRATGAATFVGFMGIGPVPALAVDPTTGIMYAATGGGSPRLFTVDPDTGAATFVGDTGLGFAAVGAMDFSADGTLYAAVNIVGDGGTGSDHLATIDTATGAATVIGPFGTCSNLPFPSCTIEGMEAIAFDRFGTLWGALNTRGAAGQPGLYTINLATGAATFSGPIHGLFGISPPGGVVSLQFACDGTLYGGTATAISPAADGGRLITLDPTTGFFSFVGGVSATGGRSLGALAFGSNCATVTAGFRGTGEGVGRGSAKTGVRILGSFLLDGAINLDTATSVTITSLLDDGNRDVAGLPLTLHAECCNNAKTAYFKTADGVVPIARVTLHDQGRGEFTFRIEVSKATSQPSNQCPKPLLTTTFLVDGITVSTQQPWLCYGTGNQYLRSPR